MRLNIGVVYCGGCNPIIDREELVRSLAGKLGKPIHPYKKEDRRVDLILVLNGCSRSCRNVLPSADQSCKTIVVAGTTIDCWPVPLNEMVDVLLRKVKDFAKVERGLPEQADNCC